MIVSRTSIISNITREREINISSQEYIELISPNKRKIQDIVPHLSDDEREFLMTGIIEEEWDTYIRGGEEE